MLKVARTETGEPEIFRSIQGEGPMAGRVRTFMRLSGCNLHCAWCDTAYTWNWAGSAFKHERDRPGAPHKFDPAKEMVTLEPVEAAGLVLDNISEALVITGGEPLLQTDALLEFFDLIPRDCGLDIEVETNGTIAPPLAFANKVALFVVSPKLPHSGNDAELALRALGAYADLDTTVFKFVARTPADVAHIAGLAREHLIAPSRIYVMPEGTDSGTLQRRGKELLPAILDAGFNFSDRLHIHLFGEKRGV